MKIRADVLGFIQRMILRWSFEKSQSVTWSIRVREQLHFSRESNKQGTPASVVEPGQVYAFRNVIINPVAVPPFLRVNLDAIELHAEVDMVASGHPGLAARAHDLASFHHVAFVHINLAKVAVDRL
jgi:hypothetical protein